MSRGESSFLGGCFRAFLTLGLSIILIVLVCGGIVYFIKQIPADQQQAGPAPVRTAKEPATPKRITMDDYDGVKLGMTYDQVHEAVGVHGQEQSRAGVDGHTSVTIAWTNPDGSNMVLTFDDGRVSGKGQLGLK